MVFCMEKALVDNALWRGPRYGRRRQRSSVSEGLPYQTVRRLNRQDDGTLFLSFTPVHDDSTKKPFSRKEHADGDIGKTPVPEYPRLSGKKNGSERSCTVENEESAPGPAVLPGDFRPGLRTPRLPETLLYDLDGKLITPSAP